MTQEQHKLLFDMGKRIRKNMVPSTFSTFPIEDRFGYQYEIKSSHPGPSMLAVSRHKWFQEEIDVIKEGLK